MSANNLKNKGNVKKKDMKPKPAEKRQRKQEDWVLTLENEALAAQPADYTYQKLAECTTMRPENARMNRLGLLEKGPNLRLISRSLWLNNNRIASLRNIHDFVNNTLEFPELLGFLDVSCNELTEIHNDLFRFPNITVLYLHGNKLSEPKDIFALRKLKKLQHLTIYANPWCERTELGNMRQLVASYLPRLNKLDHNRFTRLERDAPLSTHALKILRELTGMPEDWLFKKFPKPKLTPEIEEYCNLKKASKGSAEEDNETKN
ncbi:leucine-rich repeat-containing protein 51-like [Atheta coriaria]|uniref:leucine-rich repeat-containing protein 51-like n=1 Tax=Dalotia coriaria TaxID=877792 RepID=UPI0031F474B1